MQHRYFIFDCQNNIVANHKGYESMKGAKIALARIQYKLWDRYDELKKAGVVKGNLVHAIELLAVA